MEMTAYRIWVGKPKGKRPVGGPGRRSDNIKKILERQDGVAWTGLMWLKIGTSAGLHKTLGNSLVTERLAASQKGLSPMKSAT
jgi:hypothetical protein